MRWECPFSQIEGMDTNDVSRTLPDHGGICTQIIYVLNNQWYRTETITVGGRGGGSLASGGRVTRRGGCNTATG